MDLSQEKIMTNASSGRKNSIEFHYIMINKARTKLRIEDSFGSGLIYDLKNKKIIEQYLGD